MLVRTGAAPAVVVADVQTAGRGRLGRGWTSPAGNLYASIVVARTFAAALAPAFSLVAGVVLADAVADQAPSAAPLTLKWPNDLLLAGGKLAGILVEAEDAHLVTGIGVNLVAAPPGAASLAAAGLTVTRRGLLAAVLAGLDAARRDLEEHGFAAYRTAWLARAAWLDQPVRVILADRVLTGVHRGIDERGALLLETDAGVRPVLAGDVERIRLEEGS